VTHSLVGQRTGETFQLGDQVEVKLLEVAPVSGGLRFEMVSEGRKGKPQPQRHGRPSRLSKQTPKFRKKR
jgi:ribonuclease R